MKVRSGQELTEIEVHIYLRQSTTHTTVLAKNLVRYQNLISYICVYFLFSQ